MALGFFAAITSRHHRRRENRAAPPSAISSKRPAARSISRRNSSGDGPRARSCVNPIDLREIELIDRIAASAPVRELLVVKALGHTR